MFNRFVVVFKAEAITLNENLLHLIRLSIIQLLVAPLAAQDHTKHAWPIRACSISYSL